MVNLIGCTKVSIHASAQEATSLVIICIAFITMFQSTPPRRRRRWGQSGDRNCGCFNPRLRAGGDIRGDLTPSPLEVSIHASAQEATATVIPDARSIPVSIHASAQEATWFQSLPSSTIRFQSTPPRRRRRRCSIFEHLYLPVSIHASAQEATASCYHKPARVSVSIHASAQEATFRKINSNRF